MASLLKQQEDWMHKTVEMTMKIIKIITLLHSCSRSQSCLIVSPSEQHASHPIIHNSLFQELIQELLNSVDWHQVFQSLLEILIKLEIHRVSISRLELKWYLNSLIIIVGVFIAQIGAGQADQWQLAAMIR